jgi:hypothetical protein
MQLEEPMRETTASTDTGSNSLTVSDSEDMFLSVTFWRMVSVQSPFSTPESEATALLSLVTTSTRIPDLKSV